MATEEKKGITVKIDAELHAQVREYLETHGMTMAEFVSLALDDELHPKNQMKEGSNMANTRTIAFQVPEDLFQRIKEYLQRNNLTQRQFFINLIEDELEREQIDLENQADDLAPDDEDEESEMTESEADEPIEAVSKEESEDVSMAMTM